MRRGGCSPTWRSRSPMVRTRSAVSACSGTVRTCSVRSPRCRPLGGCWTGSPRRTSRRSVPPEHGRGQRRGPRAPARTWRRGVCLDFDATITIAHSEKENAAATWKKTFGFHPLLCFLDRRDVAGGEALAGLLRKGNAGSNTAADHIVVLDMALDALPERARPSPDEEPGTWTGPRVLARSDSAGATHAFAQACVDRGVEFSFGFPVDTRVQRIMEVIPEACWQPALQTDRGDGTDLRDGAWVAEATGMIDLSAWPAGSRLVLRKERPHPGAQLTLTDVDGMRITAILTNPPTGVVPGQVAGLELRHRQHARVEDRIREAKATGLRNFPCRAWNENNAWLEVVLTAVDLTCWTKLIGFADVPDLARCEIATFRYRVLHVAARLTHAARRTHLRIDETWRWAVQIAEGFHRLRAAFT